MATVKYISGECDINTGLVTLGETTPVYQLENGVTKITIDVKDGESNYTILDGSSASIKLLFEGIGSETESVGMDINSNNVSVMLPSILTAIPGDAKAIIKITKGSTILITCTFSITIIQTSGTQVTSYTETGESIYDAIIAKASEISQQHAEIVNNEESIITQISANADQLAATISAVQAGGLEAGNAAELVLSRLDPDHRTYGLVYTRLLNDSNELRNGQRYIDFYDLVRKTIDNATGLIGSDSTTRVATTNLYQFTVGEKINIIIKPGYTVQVFRFNSSQVFQSTTAYSASVTVTATMPFIRYRISKSDNSTITTTEAMQNVLISVSPESTHKTLLQMLGTGKNKFNPSDTGIVDGYYIGASDGTLAAGSTYNTTGYIQVYAGLAVAISPRCRKFLAYDLNKTPIASTYQTDEQTNYIFTPAVDGYIRVSYRVEDEAVFQIEYGTAVTEHVPYRPELVGDWALNKFQEGHLRGLHGKKLEGFGDSIQNGSSAGGSYTHRIAYRNGMIHTNRANGGAYMANVGANNLHVQIAAAIAAGDTPDYVVFNGMTNDIHETSGITLGTISSGYTATLDETTFCGGMESVCKKLILNFLGAKILYIRVHKMTARDYTLQDTWGEKALEICRKWSIPYVDLYSEGGLNSQIDGEIREHYTLEGDGTHPNADGYNKYYVPPIESKMAAM